MNYLLANEEAECGLNPNSEDLDAEEDDGNIVAWSLFVGVSRCPRVSNLSLIDCLLSVI